jgi:acyl-CoA dehydrogenase
MDVLGGAGISRGPRNALARLYQAAPIGITVEGANILTRSLIIYGQGAIRCHPYVLKEMEEVAAGDVAAFDAFFGHIGFVLANAGRALLHGASGARFARAAGRQRSVPAPVALQRRLRAGVGLRHGHARRPARRREKLSGRLADALWQYWARPRLPLRRPASRARAALRALGLRARCIRDRARALRRADNLPARPVAWLLRVLVFRSARGRAARRRARRGVAARMLDDPEAREALTADIFVPPPTSRGSAVSKPRSGTPAPRWQWRQIRAAVRSGRIDRAPSSELADRGSRRGDRLRARPPLAPPRRRATR